MNHSWTKDQLNKFSRSDDLYVSPFYEDSKTPGTPTWIWSVVVNDRLYARAYNGKTSRWYQSAVTQKEGKIKIAGESFDVSFNTVNNSQLNAAINEAYKEKYSSSAYLSPMVSEGPVGATVSIDPR